MKIAIIDFVLEPDKPGASGLSDVVWNTASELACIGADVHIVAPYTVEPRPRSGITVHRFAASPIGYRNIIGHILIVLRAWLIVRRIPGIDLIYAPDYLSTGIIAPLSKTPVVLRTPGNIYERIATSNPFDWWTTQVYKLAARSSARYCALVIAISGDMARWWLRTGVPEDRCIVISNGVDLDLFYPSAQDISTRTHNDLRILYVGRLSREKNVGVLLAACSELRDRGYSLTLDIVGDGPLMADLREQVRALNLIDWVEFHGWIAKHDLPGFYRAADVLVVPSLSEPLGRIVLEGMACGTVVVGARVGGIPDHVADGITGRLFDPQSVTELVTILAQLDEHRELVTTLRERSIAYAREELPWQRIGKRVYDTLQNRLLNGEQTA